MPVFSLVIVILINSKSIENFVQRFFVSGDRVISECMCAPTVGYLPKMATKRRHYIEFALSVNAVTSLLFIGGLVNVRLDFAGRGATLI